MKIFAPLIALSLTLSAAAQQAPPVENILAAARHVAALQKQDLKGILRKGNRKIPIALFLNREEGNIQFQFYGASKTWEKFHLRLKDDHFELFEIVGGKTRNFPREKLGKPIESTDLTYEDLAMRFLYWKGGEVLGKEKVNGAQCWHVRVRNPGRAGLYSTVDIWVHAKAGALMRVVGYNSKGRPIKKFQISEIMEVDGAYTIRVMRVDTFEPVSGKTIGITRVEFENPEKPKLGRPGFR